MCLKTVKFNKAIAIHKIKQVWRRLVKLIVASTLGLGYFYIKSSTLVLFAVKPYFAVV